MDFRWCLSVGPVIILFLSILPSSQLKTVFLDILCCRVGESLSIEIPDDDQCPVSNFSEVLRVQPPQHSPNHLQPHQGVALRVQPPPQPPNHFQPHQVYLSNILLGWYWYQYA
ncbi:uncharacterized protein LOC118936452 isoform X3 [Oncorhynchus mykiss]|uniref:uncharacterized protein LOC118936452 isoform X3 n=1 Tax=Oncorhynchus mykiss TaxID=8022 RepID=UPI001878FBD9|nr:uncharacterized protein LOC118936452 isoform X3 [Oncorhynchus mykiss]